MKIIYVILKLKKNNCHHYVFNHNTLSGVYIDLVNIVYEGKGKTPIYKPYPEGINSAW